MQEPALVRFRTVQSKRDVQLLKMILALFKTLVR